ncbi:terminase small subunit [Herbaspirillum robiniae]|uniref:terminase small subunit n=1 Tax=Herbaspirillum robiniae TaxID=2014887 RepID=UPI0009A15D4A|nr:terminase small subunit [Herbaspirillum robiniae]
MKISAKVKRFIDEYLVDLNGAAAARRAGYTDKSCRTSAAHILADPKVQELLAAKMEERSHRVEITQDEVLKRLWAIGSANPGELMQFRRTCCRYCYGEGHEYQWTKGEYQRARQQADDDGKPIPDCSGGFGFDPNKPPVQGCTECFGQGHGHVFLEDTRRLAGPAATLFAGVKQSKEGLEVKTHDQVEALKLVGQHLGMFKTKVEHTGPNGGPIEQKTVIVDEKEVKAAIAKLEREY